MNIPILVAPLEVGTKEESDKKPPRKITGLAKRVIEKVKGIFFRQTKQTTNPLLRKAVHCMWSEDLIK